MKQGPNVKKLIAGKMSQMAIPDEGGWVDEIRFLRDPARLAHCAREAAKWVHEAIQSVRDASEPNLWKNADDETIAGEILKRIKEHDASRT